jgi:hypothetical protein
MKKEEPPLTFKDIIEVTIKIIIAAFVFYSPFMLLFV